MAAPQLFTRLRDRAWVVRQLRDETVGGFLLLGGALLALVWANSPVSDSYFALVEWQVGPQALHLDLSVGDWVADGLLAVFFFVVGLELKHELVVGSLSNVREAVVPVLAAVGGVVVPAVIYFGFNYGEGGEPQGWGIPMATDIAFALAVLAIVGRRLPLALRAFLLTSAVVDDLIAIMVIAVFYNSGFAPLWLLGAAVAAAFYGFAQKRRWGSPWLYLPLAVLAWWLLHNSGVHATIAGVAFGLLTRIERDAGEEESPAERLERTVHPLSAGVVVPLFALTAAGVQVDPGVLELIASPVSIGIIVALLVGKPLGIVGTAWLATRFSRAQLPSEIKWLDIVGVGLLAGIGFTVSLLIARLSMTGEQLAVSKLAVLIASSVAALVASVVLLRRGRWHAAHAGAE